MSDIGGKFGRAANDTPLHWAILLDNKTMVKFLLLNGANVTAINRKNHNPVMLACINQRFDILKMLLDPMMYPKEREAALKAKDFDPDLDLSEWQDIFVLRLLRDTINFCNMKDMTSMHAACLSGNTQIVKLLLDNGADIYRRDKVSVTNWTQLNISHTLSMILTFV